MKRLYKVDNSDPLIPRVVRCVGTSDEAMTFQAAKGLLVVYLRDQISHWRSQLRAIRAQRAGDCVQEETVNPSTTEQGEGDGNTG